MTSANLPVRPLNLKIEPKTVDDQTSLIEALKRFELEDQTFGFTIDPESGETILSGQSEMHLDLKIHRLIHDLKIAVVCGQPQVAYRETIERRAQCRMTYDNRNGFAEVELEVEPRTRNSGNEFASEIEDCLENQEYIRGVEKAVHSILDSGVAIGFPIVDVFVNWTDAVHQEGRSNDQTFQTAARKCLREALTKAGVAILEPFMKLVIRCPEGNAPQVERYIDSCRGKVLERNLDGDQKIILAHAPLGNLFGFSTGLGRCCENMATHEMSFSHYEVVPRIIGHGPDDFPPAVGMRA